MKVLITPRSYGKTDPAVFEMLEQAGLDVVRNETGYIFTKEQMLERIAGCDGVIVGVDPMDEDVINAAPRLKAIAKYGTGVDNIDLDAAARRGIKVSVTAGANSEAVADCAFGMLIAMARKLVAIDAECRRKNWKKITTKDVSRATLGIVGMGAIGKLMVRRARGFDMQVIAYDPMWDEAFAGQYGVERVSLDELFTRSDYISLHVPLIPSTREMVGAEQLRMMKKDAVLINCARGELIDENALLDALERKEIGSAALDVFVREPPDDPRWYTLDNLLLGSHCAASTTGAARNMGRMATANLIRDLEGKP
ncbi:MAG: phosphoglycerate dehydrogenase [Oscillospiraceae bacterium]